MTRIILKGARDGALSDVDRSYLSQFVAAHAGLSLQDAESTVNNTITQISQSAEDARKIAATVSIFTALSMVIGAFIACVAAAFGGSQRDEPRRLLV